MWPEIVLGSIGGGGALDQRLAGCGFWSRGLPSGVIEMLGEHTLWLILRMLALRSHRHVMSILAWGGNRSAQIWPYRLARTRKR